MKFEHVKMIRFFFAVFFAEEMKDLLSVTYPFHISLYGFNGRGQTV